MTAPTPSGTSQQAHAHGADEAAENVARRVHQELAQRPWVRRLTQVGWVAKGIVYASLGWAAIEISLASAIAPDAEYTGIVETLATGSFTRFLLVLISLGLILYIAFRLISVALINDNDLDAWAHRVGYSASAVTYIAVAWAAGVAALTGPRPNSESTVEKVSRSLLESSLGRISLTVGGCIGLGVAAYFIFKGATLRFMSQIDDTDLGSRETRFLEATGAVGWVGRGATVAAVALFVTWSAIDADPADARGLDSSLQRIANEDVGQAFVFAVGVALIVYAVYCAVSARRRRLAWHDNAEPAVSNSPTPEGT